MHALTRSAAGHMACRPRDAGGGGLCSSSCCGGCCCPGSERGTPVTTGRPPTEGARACANTGVGCSGVRACACGRVTVDTPTRNGSGRGVECDSEVRLMRFISTLSVLLLSWQIKCTGKELCCSLSIEHPLSLSHAPHMAFSSLSCASDTATIVKAHTPTWIRVEYAGHE